MEIQMEPYKAYTMVIFQLQSILVSFFNNTSHENDKK